jgi:membrane protein DedA with SNARE-associated domain/membrane-associated phospholipid phosphatase
VDVLLRLSEPWGYVLIGLLAAGEGALLLGLVLPGEASMLLGGFLVFQGRAGLGLMLVCASAGAVVGDSLGYWAGRLLGPRLRKSWLGVRVGDERWERANDHLRRRGGRAIFFGRFVGFLRALLPAIAGQAGYPYPRFMAYNAPGAIIWGSGFILLGYVAGGSWHVVEQWAGRASLLLAAVVAGAIAVALGARWVSGHLDLLRQRRTELLQHPLVGRARQRWRPQLEFLQRRLDPGHQFGLYLTVGLTLAVTGAWLFGSLLEDIMAQNELSVFDRPVLSFLAQHREPFATRAMLALASLGNPAFVAAGFGAVAAWSYLALKQSRWPALVAAAMVGGLALDDLVKVLVGRRPPAVDPLPPAAPSSFPDGHALAAYALFSAAAFIVTRRLPWRSAVWVWSSALSIPLLVALGRVYVGVCWPTDALGGLVLGAFWTTVAATATAAWPRSAGGSGSEGWG